MDFDRAESRGQSGLVAPATQGDAHRPSSNRKERQGPGLRDGIRTTAIRRRGAHLRNDLASDPGLRCRCASQAEYRRADQNCEDVPHLLPPTHEFDDRKLRGNLQDTRQPDYLF